MKKLILLLTTSLLLMSFTVPYLTKEDILFAIDSYHQFEYRVVPQKLRMDTIYYSHNDTLFILQRDLNYLPWVVDIKKAEQ